MQVLQTIPLLRVFDLAKAREFYLDFLGFRVEWEHRFEPNAPVYMQIERDGCVLHLTEHYRDCSPGATVFIRVSGLEQFHAEISAKQYRYMRPGIEQAPWNAKLMEVADLSAIGSASMRTSSREDAARKRDRLSRKPRPVPRRPQQGHDLEIVRA